MKPHRHPVPAPSIRDDAEPASSWRDQAACLTADPEAFFPPIRDNANGAKAYCRRCPVTDQCLTDALEHNMEGIWGGTNDAERARIKKGKPARPTRRPSNERPPCGTTSGYNAHRYRKEAPCQPCTDAQKAFDRQRYLDRKAEREAS